MRGSRNRKRSSIANFAHTNLAFDPVTMQRCPISLRTIACHYCTQSRIRFRDPMSISLIPTKRSISISNLISSFYQDYCRCSVSQLNTLRVTRNMQLCIDKCLPHGERRLYETLLPANLEKQCREWPAGKTVWEIKLFIQENSKPQDIVYTDGSVTKDQSRRGFTVKQGATNIHEDSAGGSSDPCWIASRGDRRSQIQWACYKKLKVKWAAQTGMCQW